MRGVRRIVLLILAVFIFNITNVSAKNVNIDIEDIKVVSNSSTVEVTKPTVVDNRISSEITFNEVNDYVTFEVTLKNNDDTKYTIEKISDNNKSKNINIAYDFEDKKISEKGTKKITIKFTYDKKVEQEDVLSLGDVKITLDLVKEDGSSATAIINSPKTADTIIMYFVLLVFSSVMIILMTTKKVLKKVALPVIFATLITPILVNATTEEVYEINISFNNAHLNGTALIYSLNIDETLKPITSYTVIYDANEGIGNIDPEEHNIDDKFNLPYNPYIRNGFKFIGWNTKPDGSGKNYEAGELVEKITGESEITLYASWENRTTGTNYEGTNTFNGKGNNVDGDIANNQNVDYLNSGIKPFNKDNREKDFILSFTVSNFDLTRGKDKNNLDTIFSIIPNDTDISQLNPGVTLRLRSGRWVFQVGNETDKIKTVYFNLADLINKEFKLIRINNGSSIKLYYSIDNQNPVFLMDLTEVNPNDSVISFGATYYNGTTDRYFEGSIDNISFKYYSKLSLSEFIKEEFDDEFPIVFSAKGPCEFNGEEGNITGDACEAYKNDSYINTNISLFSEENYTKDFEISFDIFDYFPDIQGPSTIQQTLMNIKLEDESVGYPGIVVRKSAQNIYLGVKDGKGKLDQKNFKYTEVNNLRILKKDNIIYYSINGGKYVKLSDMSAFDHTFDVPLYFGASSLPDGTPMRIVKATLTNMTIRMGKLNQEIN